MLMFSFARPTASDQPCFIRENLFSNRIKEQNIGVEKEDMIKRLQILFYLKKHLKAEQ